MTFVCPDHGPVSQGVIIGPTYDKAGGVVVDKKGRIQWVHRGCGRYVERRP